MSNDATRTITITDEDLAAIRAIRSVVADAAHHPGRDAAIQAIDRLGKTAPSSLLDFIALVWPTLYPDKPLQRTPFLDTLCKLIETYGPEPDRVGELKAVGLEPGCAECARRKAADQRFIAGLDIRGSVERASGAAVLDIPVLLGGTGCDGDIIPADVLASAVADFAAEGPHQAPAGYVAGGSFEVSDSTPGRSDQICICGRVATMSAYTPWCGRAECSRAIVGKAARRGDVVHTIRPGAQPVTIASSSPPAPVNNFSGLAVALAEREYRAANPVQPGVLIVDDPQDTEHVAPSPERAREWFTATLPLNQGAGFAISGSSDGRGPRVTAPCGMLATSIAVAQLYGFREFRIERDHAGRCWGLAANRLDRRHVAWVSDRDIVESERPTTPWFMAIRAIAIALGVENADPAGVSLRELLDKNVALARR